MAAALENAGFSVGHRAYQNLPIVEASHTWAIANECLILQKAVHVCHKNPLPDAAAGNTAANRHHPTEKPVTSPPAATADRVLHTSRRDCARPLCWQWLHSAWPPSVLAVVVIGIELLERYHRPGQQRLAATGVPCSARPLTTSSRSTRNELAQDTKNPRRSGGSRQRMCDLRAALNELEHRYRFDRCAGRTPDPSDPFSHQCPVYGGIQRNSFELMLALRTKEKNMYGTCETLLAGCCVSSILRRNPAEPHYYLSPADISLLRPTEWNMPFRSRDTRAVIGAYGRHSGGNNGLSRQKVFRRRGDDLIEQVKEAVPAVMVPATCLKPC